MILSDFPWLLMSQQMFTDAAQFSFIQRGNAKFQVTEKLVSMKSQPVEKLQATLFSKKFR